MLVGAAGSKAGMDAAVAAAAGASARAADEASAAAPLVVSPELAALAGVEELARVVRQPYAALTDADRGAVARFTAPLEQLPFEQQPTMTWGAFVSDLADVATPPAAWDGAFRNDVKRAHAMQAWAVRLATDETDQPAIAARLQELIRLDADQLLDDPALRAELRVLLALDREGVLVPRELGYQQSGQVAEMLDPSTMADLAPRARQLLVDVQTLAIPERRAAWDASIDEALRTGALLPKQQSLDLLMSEATGWTSRSVEERLRLLDALTGPADAPSLAASRFSHSFAYTAGPDQEILTHVARQFDRALDGSGALPHDLDPYSLVASEGWLARPAADRIRLLDMAAARWGEPALVHIRRDDPATFVERALGPEDLQHLRHQIADVLRTTHEAGAPPPSWLRFGDVIDPNLDIANRSELLQGLLAQHGLQSPSGAGSYLTLARERLAAAAPDDTAATTKARATALELIDRNLARVRGERTDTFSNHPDYAEVGRVKAIDELFESFATAKLARDQHVPQGAAGPGEALTW